jgi:hypothetical protein
MSHLTAADHGFFVAPACPASPECCGEWSALEGRLVCTERSERACKFRFALGCGACSSLANRKILGSHVLRTFCELWEVLPVAPPSFHRQIFVSDGGSPRIYAGEQRAFRAA